MAFHVYIIFLIAVTGLSSCSLICDNDEYLDLAKDTCFACSTTCSDNQIARRTCGPFNDLECGPLVELSEFFKDISEEISPNARTASPSRHEAHVAPVESIEHENATLLHVLLVTLLFLTGLIIVLVAVAMVMYRRRNSFARKIGDQEENLYSGATDDFLSVRTKSLVECDKAMPVTSLLKPEQ